jgi:hypothetical protein
MLFFFFFTFLCLLEDNASISDICASELRPNSPRTEVGQVAVGMANIPGRVIDKVSPDGRRNLEPEGGSQGSKRAPERVREKADLDAVRRHTVQPTARNDIKAAEERSLSSDVPTPRSFSDKGIFSYSALFSIVD